MRNSEGCTSFVKKKPEIESAKYCAFGGKKIAYRIKNQEITLPPMKLITPLECKTFKEIPFQVTFNEDTIYNRPLKGQVIPGSRFF